MAETAETPVLRRMLGARRAALGLSEMTPAKAMRLSLAKTGDRTLGVPIVLKDLGRKSLMPDDLAAALPDPALILRLDGPGGAVGLAVMCPQAVAAAIEAQTLGKVLPGAAPDRKPTATDALLMRDLVEMTLESFASLAADCTGLPAMEGYGFAGRMPDARVSAMALQDAAHLHLIAELDFSGGVKTGQLHFVLPNRTRAAMPGTAEEPGDWPDLMEKAVMASPVSLEARLCRLRLPLSEVSRLHVDQVLPLEQATLDGVELRGMDGRKLMGARLGRSGAMRAVRLRSGDAPPPQPALSAGLGPMSAAPAMPAATGPAAPGLAPADLAAPDFDAPGPLPLDPAPLDPAPLDPASSTPDFPAPEPMALDDIPALDPVPMPGIDLPD
ncbi:FliM/FliN family flagellar motor switch protein [Psychromarinibacter halotolerans]